MLLFRYTPLLLLSVFAGGCRETAPRREFDGSSAFRYLEQQVAFGPRIPGTGPHQKMAQWLDSLLRRRADTLILQSWTHITAKGDSLPLQNFLARFNSTAPERILFLAHWDTRPISDGPNSKNPAAPVPGANDGASGVALLLGVADVLHRAAPKAGVDLLFVDGEDYGDFGKHPDDVLIGSRYYGNNQPPGPKPLYAVLFDMVAGRDQQIFEEGNSVTGAPEVVELVWGTAEALGYGQHFIATPKHVLTDDHVELQKVGIRAIDVVGFDYPSWHTPEDTIDKVSAASLQIVGDVAVRLVRR